MALLPSSGSEPAANSASAADAALAADSVHAFLIQVGLLLHRHGTPSHRLERVLTQLASSLNVEGAFLYTPTSLLFSLRDEQGEVTYLRRVDSGEVDVDKLIRFDETLERLDSGELSLAATSARLEEIAQAPSPFPTWLMTLACAVSCGAIALLFRGSTIEIAASAALGLVVAGCEIMHRRFGWEQGFLEPVAGFVTAMGALSVARWLHPLDDRLVTLAGLIVMIPGLRITIALTELAAGHLSAGVARLAGGCVSLLTMTMGVGLAWRLASDWRNLPPLPDWRGENGWQWLAVLLAPIAFSIVFRARFPQWPVIAGVSLAGFAASRWAGGVWGLEGGAFCGALAVGFGSNLYARLRDRPAMVPLTPGIIVLVPGSLGYRSLTAFLDHETLQGLDFALNMVMVAVALVGGVITANVVLPPKRIL